MPGHVLVSPRRVVPRLSELSSEEVTDLFLTVQRVGRMVEKVYGATALNIALQDGSDAGQSVPHVHTHIIPRRHDDLESKGGNDAIYPMLEGEEGDVGKHLREKTGDESRDEYAQRPKFPKVDDAARKPRTDDEMKEEADFLTKHMESLKL
jgi:bis(5'-adenosyl)-triphosphatase